MPLDPIVSLSVAVAEAPGSVALFLGSGVSRDAGIPTGWEILRATQQRLRQLEVATGDDPTPAAVDEAELDRWLNATGRTDLTYSDLLELIAPDAATRREYLASFFEGKEPGPTHHALADLAAAGLVRVFVTTNFDRLLEQALRSRGIEPVVVASEDPKNPRGNHVRVMKGNPDSPNEAQRDDYAVVWNNGAPLDRDGNRITGPRPGKQKEAHIPRSEWNKWRAWNKP